MRESFIKSAKSMKVSAGALREFAKAFTTTPQAPVMGDFETHSGFDPSLGGSLKLKPTTSEGPEEILKIKGSKISLGGVGEEVVKSALALHGVDFVKGELETALLAYPQNRTDRQKTVISIAPSAIVKMLQDAYLEAGRKESKPKSDSPSKSDIADKLEALEEWICVEYNCVSVDVECTSPEDSLFVDSDGDEFLILTPDEAHEMAFERLVDSFSDYYCELDKESREKQLRDFLNVEAWAKWVIATDGVGPTLSPVDSTAHEFGNYLIFKL